MPQNKTDLTRLKKYLDDNLSDEVIRERLGISQSTLRKYRKELNPVYKS